MVVTKDYFLSRMSGLFTAIWTRNSLLAIYGFAVATLFCPYISGAAITTRWIAIAIGPWLLMNGPTTGDTAAIGPRILMSGPKIGATALWLMPFFVWVLLSLLWTAQPYDGIGETIQWAIAIGVFLFGASVDDPKPLYFGFGVGILVAYPFGLFDPNADLVAEAAAPAFIAALVTRQWLLSGLLPIVLVLSHVQHHCAKGAILGATCALAVLFLHRSWKTGLIIVALGLALVGCLTYLTALSDNLERIHIWQDTYAGITLFGHGIGSFRYVFPDFASHINIILGTRPDHAHNDFLEILFELGYVGGFLALVGLGVILYRGRNIAEALIVVCVIGTSLTNFPLHIPSTLFMAAFALGRVCRLDSLCSQSNERRVLVPA